MANNKLVTVDVLLHNNEKIKEQLNKKVNIDQGVDNKGKLLGINDLGQVSLVDTPDGATISAENGNIISRKEDGLFAEDTIVEILVDGNTVPIVDKKVDIALKTINDLENYYLKTETYSADEIDDLLSAITTLNILAVDTLPTENISTTTIYLVSNGDTEENNIHDEYICLDSTVPTWEKIGSTKVDLTDYVKSEKLTEELENYVLKVEGKGLSTHDLTDELLEKITQNDKIIEISKADYDLLTDEEKRDKIYYVYDDENGVLTWSTLSEKPFESIDVESFAVGEDGILSLKDEYVKTDDVEQMFKDELYTSTTTPAHYEISDSSNPNALEVVADGTATDGQIDLSNVADIGASIGNFVVFVDEVTTTDTKYAEKTNVYSKSETDEKIAEAVTGGTVSLDGYVQKTELETTLEDYTTDDELSTALADYTKTTDADEKYVLDSDMEIIDLATLESMLGLSTEELEGLASLILDSEIRIDKTFSSSKIYSDLQQVLSDSKSFTLSEIAKASTASYKVVDSTANVTDAKYIYLIANSSNNYDMYILDDVNGATRIGETTIDLSGYLTTETASQTYVLQTVFDVLSGNIGDVTTLQTSDKTLVGAVNELKIAIDNAEIEISEETDNLLEEKEDGLFVGSETITISKADYDALSVEEKSNGKTYFVPDDETTEDGTDLTQFAKVSDLEDGTITVGNSKKLNGLTKDELFAETNNKIKEINNNLAQLIKTTTVTASADMAANSYAFISVSLPETPSGYRRLFAFIQGGSGSIDTSQLLVGSGTTGCRVYNNLSQKQTVTIECRIVYIKNC